MTKESYAYRYIGPNPGSHWADPRFEPILRDVHTIISDLHEHAGRPRSDVIANAINVSRATVIALLGGRYLPTWSTVEAIGRYLARVANASETRWVNRLRGSYARVRGDVPPPVKKER